MNIIVDSREQNPYKFENQVIKGLKTGDYSIEGFEEEFAVERKSLGDFVGSITQGRERFEEEIQRAKSLKYFALIIESDTRGIWNTPLHSKIARKAILSTPVCWTMKYPYLHVFFASNRSDAKQILLILCENYLRYKKEGII